LILTLRCMLVNSEPATSILSVSWLICGVVSCVDNSAGSRQQAAGGACERERLGTQGVFVCAAAAAAAAGTHNSTHGAGRSSWRAVSRLSTCCLGGPVLCVHVLAFCATSVRAVAPRVFNQTSQFCALGAAEAVVVKVLGSDGAWEANLPRAVARHSVFDLKVIGLFTVAGDVVLWADSTAVCIWGQQLCVHKLAAWHGGGEWPRARRRAAAGRYRCAGACECTAREAEWVWGHNCNTCIVADSELGVAAEMTKR
jgi:hypothetical protein